MVTERMFLPLDSEFKVTVKAEPSSDAQQILDGQCAELRHLWEACRSKLEIVERMVGEAGSSVSERSICWWSTAGMAPSQ